MSQHKPWWLAAAVIAFGGVWIYGAQALSQTSTYAKVGPGLFVTIVGAALVVLGVLLAWQIFRGESFEAQASEGADASQPVNQAGFWLGLLGIALPLVLMTLLGFVLTATASFVAIAAAFGERKVWRTALVGFCLAALAWTLFSRLGVTLGPFATLRLK